jgi:hypothetical protein
MKLKKIYILLLFCLGSLCSLFADTVIDDKILSLEKFVELAVKQNPEFEKILMDELKLKYNKFLLIPNESILVDIKSDYSLENQDTLTSIGLSKLFLNTGAEISITHDNSNGFFLEANQSILRNAFGRANRLMLEGIEINNKIIKYEIIEAYEKYLNQIIKLYYDWCKINANLETAKNVYSDSLKFYNNIKGKKNNSDTQKAYIQTLTKQEELKSFELEYKKIYNLIIQATRINENELYTPNIDIKHLDIDLDNSYRIDFFKSYQTFKSESRTYFIYDLLKQKNLNNLKLSQDDYLDDFLIKASYTNNSDTKAMFIGANYQTVFLDKKYDAELDVKKIEYDKNLLDLSIQKFNLDIILKNFYENFIFQKELLKITNSKIKNTENVLEEDIKSYMQGKLSLQDTLDTFNALNNFKYEKIDRNLKIKSLYIDWQNIMDLLVKNNQLFKDETKK